MRPGKRKPAGGNLRASEIVGSGQGSNGAKDNAQMASARILALSAVNAARAQLDRYATATDDPMPRIADAADLLDAAASYLAPAEFADALADACGGAA